MSARIAILDDEARLAEVLAMLLRREGYEAEAFSSAARFFEAFEDARFDLLLTDLKMPGEDGLDVLAKLRRRSEIPVIVMTAHASIATAIEAMRRGAFDYIEKPFDDEAIKAALRRALEHSRLSRENRYLRAELARRDGEELVSLNPAMTRVFELARRAARSEATVLIQGESGTGKELVARAIHVHSERVAGPFIAVNCQALAPGVLESELFGHERGAFTGAERSRPGLFERAQGGTLFLDEIGEVDGAFQTKLLRVLQEREATRVGGEAPRSLDFRLVSATNKDLKAESAAGRFREDLYYRLAVIPVQLLPLRERREDVLPLARLFLERFARGLGRDLTGWSEEVEAWLLAHDWPGNVRELENLIERAAVLARDERIALADLLVEDGGEAGGELGLHDYLDRMAAERITEELRRCRGNKSAAAERLKVDRTTLYRLIKRLGLDGEAGAVRP